MKTKALPSAARRRAAAGHGARAGSWHLHPGAERTGPGAGRHARRARARAVRKTEGAVGQQRADPVAAGARRRRDESGRARCADGAERGVARRRIRRRTSRAGNTGGALGAGHAARRRHTGAGARGDRRRHRGFRQPSPRQRHRPVVRHHRLPFRHPRAPPPHAAGNECACCARWSRPRAPTSAITGGRPGRRSACSSSIACSCVDADAKPPDRGPDRPDGHGQERHRAAARARVSHRDS